MMRPRKRLKRLKQHAERRRAERDRGERINARQKAERMRRNKVGVKDDDFDSDRREALIEQFRRETEEFQQQTATGGQGDGHGSGSGSRSGSRSGSGSAPTHPCKGKGRSSSEHDTSDKAKDIESHAVISAENLKNLLSTDELETFLKEDEAAKRHFQEMFAKIDEILSTPGGLDALRQETNRAMAAQTERRRRWEAVTKTDNFEPLVKGLIEMYLRTVGETSSPHLFGASDVHLLSIPRKLERFSNIHSYAFDDRYPPLYVPPVDHIEIHLEDLKEFDTAHFLFVIVPDHQCRICLNHEDFRGGHATLAGGEDVISAGDFQLYQGDLYYFSLQSGHYMPKGFSAERAIEIALNQAVFETRGKYLARDWGDERDDAIRAGRWHVAEVKRTWSTKPSGSGGP